MTPADLDQVRRLVAEVDQQLREHRVSGRSRLVRKLESLVQRAADQPTDQGLAMYVNLAVDRCFQLPIPVAPRALVERTFATRPLLTALHRMPPHVLLVLHATCAHLYQGGDGGLRSVGHRDLFRGAGVVRIPRQHEPGAEEASDDVMTGFLRGVDRLLGDYRAEHPSPLVLGGSPVVVDRFRSMSRHLDRLAGRLPDRPDQSALDLAWASSEVVELYLRSRRDDALTQLKEALAARPGDVACGIDACWEAAHERAPSMLLVEEDYVSPGPAGEHPTEEAQPRNRADMSAVHDLVDDLMEAVIVRGGHLALMASGDLVDVGRVALVSRPTG
jgi:hypothetical protein